MKRTLVKKTPGARNLSRREMLGFTRATVVTALMGSSPGQSGSGEPTRTAAVTAPSCVVRPQQTLFNTYRKATVLDSSRFQKPNAAKCHSPYGRT